MKFDSKPWLYSFVGICFLFLLHFLLPSMVNGFQKGALHFWESNCWNHEFGESLCLDRIKKSEFYRRPLTYQSQLFLYRFGIPFQFSFNLISFLSYYLSSVLLYKISIQFGIEKRLAWISTLTFYLHFTILFAFFGSISTYDEPLMYLFLTLSLYMLLSNKIIIATLVFILACLARETSMFLLPLFFIIPSNIKIGYRILAIVTIIFAYILFFNLYVPKELIDQSVKFLANKRFYAWQRNFMDLNHGFESLLCLFLSVGIPFYILKRILDNPRISYPTKTILQFTILLLIINSIIVLVMGLAIEARLFALPMLLVWPIIPTYFSTFNLPHFLNYLRKNLILLGFIFILSIVLIKLFYVCSEYTEISCRFFKAYAIFYITMFFAFIMYDIRLRNSIDTSSTI